MLFSLLSCTTLHEAQRTIAEADSLRSVGVAYDDSLRLDSAYTVLGTWWNRTVHPDDYARACYYYGRLHRNRGNQVEAMKCFINGTHADPQAPYFQRVGFPIRRVPSDGFALLGRIYSNIGTMCHLANEFQMSYEIYERSSEYFKKADDTTAYYYSLNNMAFELAEQKRLDDSFYLLDIIKKDCKDSDVIKLSYLTRARGFLNVEQYDSALYYAGEELKYYPKEPTGLLIKARSFSAINVKDSAIYYANKVIENSNHSGDIYNALYILSYDNPELSKEEVLEVTSDRADVIKLELNPLEEQLAQAVQLLEQDINQKPNYKGLLIGILIALFIICTFTVVARHKIKLKRKELRMLQERNLYENEKERQETKKQTIIEHQKQQQLLQKQQQIEEEIKTLQKKNDNLLKQQLQNNQSRLNLIDHNCEIIKSSDDLYKELCWKDYDRMCGIINTYFFMLAHKLKKYYNLSEQEIKLCILVLLEQNQETISQMLNYSSNGIGKFKYRVSKKMGTTNKKLREIILEISVGECFSEPQTKLPI